MTLSSVEAELFGLVEGTIEALEALPLEPGSFDVVVSNCVLNLSTDKAAVLQGVKRLLKPGGEMYFSDVYVDRRLPESVRRDPVLYGECLGGALYWNDFLRLAKGAGFPDPRLVSDRELRITEPALAPLVGEARFYAATYRLFNIAELEDACEDHGQAVIYRGTIPHHLLLLLVLLLLDMAVILLVLILLSFKKIQLCTKIDNCTHHPQ